MATCCSTVMAKKEKTTGEEKKKTGHASTPALVAMGFHFSPNYDVRGAAVLSNCYKETC